MARCGMDLRYIYFAFCMLSFYCVKNQILQEYCPSECFCPYPDHSTLTVDCAGYNDTDTVVSYINTQINELPDLTSMLLANLLNVTLGDMNIPKLGNLEVLRITNCVHISFIPPTYLWNLTRLKDFQLTGGTLTSLDDNTFSGLTQLQTINLSKNNITDVGPRTFLKLPSLTSVDISHNLLKTLDIWPLYLSNYHKLEVYINADHNEIGELTNRLNWRSMVGNIHVVTLSLDYNHIHHLSYFTTGYGLGRPEESVFWLSKAVDYSLYKNGFVCDCTDFDIILTVYSEPQFTSSVDEVSCEEAPDPSWKNTLMLSHHPSEFVCDIRENCPGNCTCWKRPGNETFHVLCQDSNLETLPDHFSLPSNMSEYSILLNFQNNIIQELEGRSYFNRTSSAYFSGNQLKYVSVSALGELDVNCTILELDNNLLTQLSPQVKKIDFNGLQQLSLHGNLWNCNCAAQWMPAWLDSTRTKLVQPESITCTSPSWLQDRRILTLSAEDFCSGNPEGNRVRQIVIFSVSAALGTFLSLVLPVIVLYIERVWVYKTFKWHPFDLDECRGEMKQFDAFVAYATPDEPWVLQFISTVESMGFKINFHRRDFHGGMSVSTNIEKAVTESKRVIVVLSNDFIESEVCMWEFDLALSLALQIKASRLVVLKSDNLDMDAVPMSAALYMKRHTYIEINSRFFLESIVYALPVERLGVASRDGGATVEPADTESVQDQGTVEVTDETTCLLDQNNSNSSCGIIRFTQL